MANYDYFKQYVSEMERIKAKTAHEQHIVEFQAMCAKRINDAIPEITQQVKAEVIRDLRTQAKPEIQKAQEVKAVFSPNQIRNSLLDAIKRAFRH